MLEDNSDSWLHQWEAQGIQKGLTQGLAQGLSKGLEKGLRTQKNTLIRQLRHKFGSLPAACKQTINQAASRQLGIWSLRLLDARTLDDVFNTSDS